jgi:large subunit ribosomal protein L10
MALSKQQKQDLIAKYSDALKNSKSAVYVSFAGLPVKEQEILRKKLFAADTHYTVVKKTLWDRAIADAKITGDAPTIPSEMAVVWGADLMIPAKEANEFAKSHKEKFAILGGVWDGQFKTASEMMAIANIPSREVLLSQLAYLLKSPMQRIAIAVNEVAKKKA